VLASIVSTTFSLLLGMGRLYDSSVVGTAHTYAMWGAFCGGVAFIGTSIACTPCSFVHYTRLQCCTLSGVDLALSDSALMPKLEDSLTYGYSFILVLASGFFVLIGGLVFVLSRQVSILTICVSSVYHCRAPATRLRVTRVAS